jgi:hypothetical protein
MLSLQIVKPRTYADQVNQQFDKSESQYVSIGERLDSSTQNSSWQQQALQSSMNEFRLRNPQIQDWSHLTFCKALKCSISDIAIDVTLQRKFDFDHCCMILDNFDQLLVMPISVYEDDSNPGKYICWDGQHTAIVLHILASMVFGKNLDNCEIPIVVYGNHQKADMRKNLIVLNTVKGKKYLDTIDIIHQILWAVRTDNSMDLDYRLVDQKYGYLEQNGMFLTHQKFGDDHRPGAQSRLEEFMDTRYSPEITGYFAKYFFMMCRSNRPVQPKESWLMYDFFKLCKSADIDITDQYISSIVKSLQKSFNGDIKSIQFMQKAYLSYQNWWLRTGRSIDGSLRGISYSEKRIGLAFLIAQLSKEFKGELPEYEPHWEIAKEDLY